MLGCIVTVWRGNVGLLSQATFEPDPDFADLEPDEDSDLPELPEDPLDDDEELSEPDFAPDSALDPDSEDFDSDFSEPSDLPLPFDEPLAALALLSVR
jgi:hypothetical protein